jgi:hypothetical protein
LEPDRSNETSDDLVFHNEILANVLWLAYSIAEVTWLIWPVKYLPGARVINFRRSPGYGFACVGRPKSERKVNVFAK